VKQGERGVLSTLIQAAVALVLFGCIPVVIRYISANPFTIGIFRLAVTTAGVALIMTFRGDSLRIARPDLTRVALIGVVFFCHWITYFFSIKMSSASIAALGLSTYGIQLMLLGAYFGHSRLHVIDVTAVALAVAGAIAIVPKFDLKNDVTIGALLAVLSAFFYALLPILHQRSTHIPAWTRALGQFTAALVLFLLFLPKSDWNLRPIDWAGLLFLGIGSTLIGHTLWVFVTTKLSPASTSVIYYGNLPIALVLSVTLLGEPFRGRTAIGALLILAGGLLGLRSQWQRNAIEAVVPE
jgi:drug/metabolite transporter (DMT)-like permease